MRVINRVAAAERTEAAVGFLSSLYERPGPAAEIGRGGERKIREYGMKYRYPAKDFLSCSFPPIDLVAHIDRRKEIPPQIAASNKKSRQEMRVRLRCARAAASD